MEKAKKIFSKITSLAQGTFKTFPITVAIIYILTILLTVFENTDAMYGDFFMQIMYIGTLWGLGSFLVESILKKSKKEWKIIIGEVITLIISIVFVRILTVSYNQSVVFLIRRLLITYIFSIILISIYYLSKNSEVKFGEYLLRNCSNLLEVNIIYLILNIGILLLYSIFNILILEGTKWDFVFRILTLLFGLFYLPAIINSISEVKEKESKFIKSLIIHVLMNLILVAIAIVYMYIVKIFALQELPRNVIFRILASIFIFALPVSIMANTYSEENKFVKKVSKLIVYLYIPLMFLEIYSMWLRSSVYGLTPMRYMAYVFVLCQAIIIFLDLYKNGKYLRENLLAIVAVIIVAVVSPFNYQKVSNLSQKKILDEYVEKNITFEECTNEEKARVVGAYQYLQYQEDKEKYINSNLTEEDERDFLNFYIYQYSFDEEDEFIKPESYFYVENRDAQIDVSKYSKIHEIIENKYTNPEKFRIITKDVEAIVDCSIEELMEELVSKKESQFLSGSESFVDTFNDKYTLYIKEMVIVYDNEKEKVKTFNIDGYLLER